jgi:hypothetical protein
MTFRVQQNCCATCIYRKDSPLNLVLYHVIIKKGSNNAES